VQLGQDRPVPLAAIQQTANIYFTSVSQTSKMPSCQPLYSINKTYCTAHELQTKNDRNKQTKKQRMKETEIETYIHTYL